MHLLFTLPMDQICQLATLAILINLILFLQDTYFDLNLTLNLISVRQLCDLGFDLHFSFTGYHVQDTQIGKLIGTSRKVEHLFELTHLQISSLASPNQSAASIPTLSLVELWLSRLCHTLLSHLRSLISSGQLDLIQHESLSLYSLSTQKTISFTF